MGSSVTYLRRNQERLSIAKADIIYVYLSFVMGQSDDQV